MSLLSVFDEIVSIMHNDYAGIIEKNGCDKPELYKEKLVALEKENNLTRENFYDIVQEYLLDFKDKHISLINKNKEVPQITTGFKVRRFKDALYITQITEEEKLKKGMKIISLDNKEIKELAESNRNLLRSDIEEREDWDKVLLKHKSCLIEYDNQKIHFEFNLYPYKQAPSEYTLTKIQDKTLLLNINDFLDSNQLFELIEKNKNLIEESENLIIDIRVNAGGSDTAYEPLLKDIFPPKSKIVLDGTLLYITERNYNNRFKFINEWKKTLKNKEEVKQIDQYLDELKNIINKGFVELESTKSQTIEFDGELNPKKIIVLIDRYCGSSGDQFALISSYSSKAKLIGRNTSGVIDYSNVAFEKFDDYGFDLMYPTTKSTRVIDGRGIDNIGVKPDIYIPWTPEHIDRDIDLEIALDYINRG
ncbi:MAG: S41 family peptidase [Candidatus Sericytochromatia bacterium]